jgi:hemerythrin-like metal-binding protein
MRRPVAENSALLVGIPQIDNEHAELMAVIDRLIGPPALHIRSDKFSEILSRLGLQLVEHFRHEEEFIRSCGLPAHEVAAHIDAHGEILEQYTRLQLDLMCRTSPNPVEAEIVAMTRSWIVDHFEAFDLKLQAYTPLAALC